MLVTDFSAFSSLSQAAVPSTQNKSQEKSMVTTPRCCPGKVPENLSQQTLSSVRPRLVLPLLVLTSH